jgi:hypothetical protein
MLFDTPEIIRMKNGMYRVIFHRIERDERFDSLWDASKFINQLEAAAEIEAEERRAAAQAEEWA